MDRGHTLSPNARHRHPTEIQKPVVRAIKHSEIMRRNGHSVFTATSKNVQKTSFGVASELFSCNKFVVRTEIMGANTSTGYGFNAKKNKCIIVSRGVIYVTIENTKGEKEQIQLLTGTAFKAPAGTRYSVATNGTTEAELFVVEDVGYTTSWTKLEEPVIIVKPLNDMNNTLTHPIPRRGNTDTVKAQMTNARRERDALSTKERNNATFNPNCGNVEGVNLIATFSNSEDD